MGTGNNQDVGAQDQFLLEPRMVCVALTDGRKKSALLLEDADGTQSFMDDTGDVTGDVDSWSYGACVADRIEKLCEFDDEKLLLVDGNAGAFAEYSLTNESLTDITALTVTSNGATADPDNFLLYAVTITGDLQIVDVNTKVTISQTPLFTNDGSPLVFSALHFFNGMIFAADNGVGFPGGVPGPDWNIYTIDPNTAEVAFYNGPWTGIVGYGYSLMVNPLDGKFYISGFLGTIYEIGSGVSASGAAVLTYDSPNDVASGATFDLSGNLYLAGGPNVYRVDNFPLGPEEQIIDNWAPGVNSLTFYRTEAQSPRCFYRKYDVLENGDLEYVSDHFIADFSPRVISGAVDCCSARYLGPSAAEIASATISAEQTAVAGAVISFAGSSTEVLPVPPGTRGNLVAIEDNAAGVVYFTTDGTVPTGATGLGSGEVFGPYHAGMNLRNIDLSLLRFAGSASPSEYVVYYEIFL